MFLRWGRGLPRKGVGAKKFGMPLETREIKLFGGISRDFAGFSRNPPKSFEKKSLCSIFGPYLGVQKVTLVTFESLTNRGNSLFSVSFESDK